MQLCFVSVHGPRETYFVDEPRIWCKDNDFYVPGPEVSAADNPLPQYSVETLAMAVVAGSVAALMVGFVTGYFCGRKCHKEEEDNLPYPDTEYEYFEQRQTVNRYCSYFLVFLAHL
jgi:H+/gluconate symporter-like permease